MRIAVANALLRFTSRGPRRPLPLGIRALRIYILPTGRGLLFAFAVTAMIGGALNYTNNPGFLFAFLLASMALMSTLYTQKNIKVLTLVSEKHVPVFAGKPLWFELAVKADAAPRYRVAAGFKDHGRVVRDIPAGETVTFRLPLETLTRGRFRPPPLIVESTYPFGLFRTWVSIRLDTHCLVFPAPLPHAFETAAAPTPGQGAGTSPHSETGDFRELKTYRPGDPGSRIAWKPLARGQGLWTKSFEAEQNHAVTLSWDLIRATGTEARISHLCHLVLEAHRQGISYGLRAPGIAIAPGAPGAPGSIPHRDRCLTALAMMPPSD